MSKTSIPTIKLSGEECDTLFKSITEKLNIENPKFFYPIYKKIIDDDSIAPEELRCTVLDSKFKCKEILLKIVDSDNEYDDENEDEDEEEVASEEENKEDETNNSTKDEFKHLQNGGDLENTTDNIDNDNDNDTDTTLNILSKDGTNIESLKDVDVDIDSDDDSSDESIDGDDDDAEINEAINNTFMAKAIIERTNKSTGEKTYKEEKIHIKKTALLESLKIMNDEYVIPSKIQNKDIADETLKNTMSKLNSYNNSGHVESLFLYLGNKLVESGKCPSFPYYYGCINGDDPNYHHNITDEYDTVSRSKWFRDRIKTDFDLLIIESDDIEDYENKVLSNVNKTINKCNEKMKGGGLNTNDDDIDIDSDSDEDKNSDKNSGKNSDSDESSESSDSSDSNDEEDEKSVNVDNADTNDINLNKLDVSKSLIQTTDFIKDIDNEDLEIIDCNNCGVCIECCTAEKCISSTSNTDDLNDLDILDNLVNLDINKSKNGHDHKHKHKHKHNEDCGDCDDSDDCEDDNSFIEELSDIDKDNLSLSEFDNNSNNMYYIKCESMPVSLSLMEKLDKTLDDILDEEYNMKETEWFSVFFQVAFGLAVAQKYFSFVHNDLHSSNVMFKSTKSSAIYYQINSNYYRIPTYGKITKIIDFARGTFKFGDRWVFSDQFKEDNDAHGQYDYPVDGSLKNCEHKPNPSFDLVRLGTTVIQRLEDLPKVREFVEQITIDDNGSSLCYDEDAFQLYIDIAHNCHNAIPLNVMARPEFERFKINKNKIPKGQYVFKY